MSIRWSCLLFNNNNFHPQTLYFVHNNLISANAGSHIAELDEIIMFSLSDEGNVMISGGATATATTITSAPEIS